MNITFLIGHMVKERDLILYELATQLGEYGAKVTIISGYPSRRLDKKTIKYYHEHPIEKYSLNVSSIRVGTKRGEGNNLFTRMINYLILSKQIYKCAIKQKTDVFYIYSTPPFLAYYAKKLRKIAPVVYNAQDLFPDSLKIALRISEKTPLMKFLRIKEKEVYQNSDKIITISDDMKKTICSNGADEKKVKVIQNWADTKAIIPVKKTENNLYKEFNISKEKFTVLYAGDIGLHQHLDVFFEAAKLLQEENIQFIFFGNGAYVNTLKENINYAKLNNFKIFPLQPVNRISEVYCIGDLDIISLEKGMTHLALPSKLWSIMSAGRPVLAQIDLDSELAKFIDNNIGYVFSEVSSYQLAEIIKYCMNNREKLISMGNKARKLVCKENNKEIQIKKYFDELVKIISD